MFTRLSRDGASTVFSLFCIPWRRRPHTTVDHMIPLVSVRQWVISVPRRRRSGKRSRSGQAKAPRLAQTLLAGDCAASSATVPRPSPRSRGSFSAGLGWTRLDSTGVERLPLAAADRLVGRTRRDRDRHSLALRAEATSRQQARFGEGLRSCSHSGIFGGVLKSRHCTRRDERPYHSPKC